MATLLKTLTLTLDDGGAAPTSVECQLSKAVLVDEPETEEVSTFCGKDVFATPAYVLQLGGFQDYGAVNAICDMLHDAYKTDPVTEIDFVLTVGTKTRTGVCKPTKDVDFGGDAGSALKFDVDLTVVGIPTDGTTP